jgi:hypothetical protein
MSMVLIAKAYTRAPMICNLSVSTYTTTKSDRTSMFLVQYWLTSNLEPWILSRVVLLVTYSALTIMSSVKVALVITGQKDVSVFLRFAGRSFVMICYFFALASPCVFRTFNSCFFSKSRSHAYFTRLH